MPSFGEILCELREDRRLTQTQLARELHMAPTTISGHMRQARFSRPLISSYPWQIIFKSQQTICSDGLSMI